MEHVGDDSFILFRFLCGAEQCIVFVLVFDDIGAGIKNRGIQIAFLAEEQNIQNSAGSAVAIPKGVDALKLIVCQCDFNQRMDRIAVIIIDVIQHINQQFLQEIHQ